MNAFAYLLRSVWFHRRTHLALFTGAVLTSAVVCTSLLIGDSVRGTLAALVDRKLQDVASVADTGDGFFRASLIDRALTEHESAVALRLDGSALGNDNRRVAHVNVLGVDDDFFGLSRNGGCPKLKPMDVALNSPLATRLAVSVGDEVVLRIEKPGILPGDAPLSLQSSKGKALRFTVTAILTAEQLGDFTIRNATEIPANAFVDRIWLAETMELAGKANVIVSKAPKTALAGNARRLTTALEPEDVGLMVDPLGKTVELRSQGIFLPETVADGLEARGEPIFTYFVNACRFKGRETPYFFVCGSESLVPASMAEDAVIINRWLADDLGVGEGGTLTLTYFIMDPRGGLREQSTTLTVHGIEPTVDRRDLMPAFPGMADAESCSDWDAGLPIDLDKIRDKDETYWDDFKGTPRIFLHLKKARELWGNRFGELTAIRFDQPIETVRAMVKRQLDAEAFGLVPVPVKDQRLAAGRNGVDFGGLFMGLSFFVIVAALALTGLLFAFSIQQRAEESAILSATGFTKGRIVRTYVTEALALIIPASMVGAACAIGLNRVVLERIATVWQGAVNSVRIAENVRLESLALGIGITIVVSLATVIATGYKSVSGTVQGAFVRGSVESRSRTPWIVTIVFLGGAIALSLMSDASGGKEMAVRFMGAGFCALICLIALYSLVLRWLRSFAGDGQGTVLMVARALAGNASRNLALVGIMGVGIFLVAGVSANRFDPSYQTGSLTSGTGGYELFGQLSVPILERLDAPAGRKAFQLDMPEADGIEFNLMKVKPGADASCLNLSKVMDPGVLGVDARVLHERGAFTFAKTMDGGDAPWLALERTFDDGAIPVIADVNVILWSLGKGVGDTMVLNGDSGNPVTVRFVGGLKNSVFQGWILMDRSRFAEAYPSISGNAAALIDCPSGGIDGAESLVREAFVDSGIELERTGKRLARFNRVENTYLEIFQMLSVLGLLIGTAGLALVVSRNVLERRSELAVMRAVGYSKSRLRVLLFIEHAIVFADGVLIGVVSGLVAIIPAMRSQAGDVPWVSLGVQVAAMSVAGFLWIWVGCLFALRTPLLNALRNE